ncbi:MAG: sugar ABC transporter ATP-binding protein [Solirubrobacterales bacterium]|nr:sugar ABC transporter ATP-binding protein [Solirubrobacterales bacterium]
MKRPGGHGHAGASEPASARSAPLGDPLGDVIVDAIQVQAGQRFASRRASFEREVAGARPRSAPDDVLRLCHVAKSFGALVALRDINLHLRAGEALGLIGENASGKSTLLKIVAGFHSPDAGQLVVRGTPVDLKGVGHARSLGIDCVYQDLALIDELSVWQNISLSRETVHQRLPLLARRRMRAVARDALDDLGVRVDSVDVSVAHLSRGQRQAIALARSIHSASDILLLDEPIAALGAKEAATMMSVLARLRERSPISIIFVAHVFGHVLEVCDRVNLIENGCIALDKPTSDTSIQELTDVLLRGL